LFYLLSAPFCFPTSSYLSACDIFVARLCAVVNFCSVFDCGSFPSSCLHLDRREFLVPKTIADVISQPLPSRFGSKISMIRQRQWCTSLLSETLLVLYQNAVFMASLIFDMLRLRFQALSWRFPRLLSLPLPILSTQA